MKILVVENSPLIRRLICGTLARAGISNVLQADSGRQALDHLAHEVPGLIIIGLDLSGMSGLQFALRVRMSDDFGHVPMIMISQKSTYADVLQAVKCGIDNYVVMPFPEDLLVSKVRQLASATPASAPSRTQPPFAL
ncbi:MAG: response regulator [Rhodothermales bacterium]